MSTSNKYANITQKKLLGYRDLNDRFLQYIRDLVHEAHSRVWDASAVHDGALTIEADGTNAIKITGTSIAADGEGRLLRISDAAVNDDINFENTNLVDYYVALKYTDVPYELDINPRTGNPEFQSWTEEVGEKDVPDAVTDNGNGTITFQVDSVTEAGVTNAGRQVLVYKLVIDKNATTFAVAVETCTVSWSGSQNEITTTGTLGQSTVSTTAADYNVIMLGPTIKRYVDLRSESGYVFIGIVTGNGGTPADFDHTDQNLATVSLSQLANIASKAPNGRAKIDVIPAIGEAGIGQIQSRDENQNIVFRVDELGRVEMDFPPFFNRSSLREVNDSKTRLDVGAATNIWYSMSSAIIDGVRKLIVPNYSLDATLEIYDCETMTLDGNTGELPGLPDISPDDWHAAHVICDDQYAYVYFVSDAGAGAMQMQCYDLETWTVRSGWPSTGVVVTTGVGFVYAGRPMAHIDEDTFAFCTYESISASTTAAVKIVNKADGSIAGQGAGDAPTGTSDQIKSICCDGNYIYGLTHKDYICSIDPSSPSSGCGGSGWPLTITVGTSNNGIKDIACGSGLIVAVGDDNTKRLIHVATSDNANIGRVYSGDFSKLKTLDRLVYDGSVFWALGTREYDINRHILAAGATGPYVSNNNGKNWAEISDGFGTFFDMVLYSSGIVVAATGPSGRIFRSADFGFTWTEEADTLSGDVTSIIGWSNGSMAAGDETGDIHQSTDYGDSWSEVESALDSTIWCMAAFSGGIGLAGTGNNGKIFRTVDYGANWTEEADTTEISINCIATFSNGSAVAGTGNGGSIFQSTDYGDSWSEVEDTSETNITAIATLDDGKAIACADGDGKIFRSTNYGADWTQVLATGDSYLKAALMLSNGTALISSLNKMYRSTDFGVTWEVVSTDGLSADTIKVFEDVAVADRHSLYKLNVRSIVNHSDDMPAIELNGEDIVEPFSFDYSDVHSGTIANSPLHFDGRDIWMAPKYYNTDEIFRLIKTMIR